MGRWVGVRDVVGAIVGASIIIIIRKGLFVFVQKQY